MRRSVGHSESTMHFFTGFFSLHVSHSKGFLNQTERKAQVE